MTDYLTQPKVNNVQISIIAEAEELKLNALLCSKDIASVEDGFEAKVAADAQKTLRGLIKNMEESRKAVKAPILQIGRNIDGIAKDFLEDVKLEEERLAKLLGDFQKVERQKKISAEREAINKEKKLLMKASEEALATGQNITDLDAKTQTEIATLHEEAAMKHEAVKGLRVKTTIKFEIEDDSLLMKARPDLFSPDETKIRRALKTNNNIPGIKAWEETKAY